jgi:4-amino-4-deoxy-L-arabinose transferase-like glycosyltransferase
MGLFVGIGVLLKASVVIAFVAVLLDIFTSKINKKILCRVALCLGVTAIVFSSWNVIFQKSKWVDTQEYESLNMPVTHWVMMALKGDGGYRQEDFDFSNSFPSRAEKKAAQIEEIKNRVRSYGSVDNFVEFEVNKIAKVLADNRYIQNNHMEWCRNRGLLFEVVLEKGRYFSKFSAYTKIFGTTMFILWLFGIYKGIRDKNKDKDFLLNVTIFGVILFFMLWETRSRYLLNYTPVFLLAAVGGISELKMLFDKNKK